MSLTADDVKKIAHLARLNLDESTIDTRLSQLSSILAFVDQMSKADTNGIEPLAHPLDISQRLRNDTTTEPNHRDLFLSIAPQAEAGLYLVPKVIEEA